MTERFSLRRVNPFLGAVAVVKTDAGRAVSVDGRQWQLQVLAHPPRALWSRAGEQTATRYLRFGVWSETRGLSRVPLNPILDVGRMVATAQDLVELLRAGLDRPSVDVNGTRRPAARPVGRMGRQARRPDGRPLYPLPASGAPGSLEKGTGGGQAEAGECLTTPAGRRSAVH